MQRFKRILFLADHRSRESNALAHAVELARRNGAHLSLIDAMEDGLEVADLIRDARLEILSEMVEEARRAGVEADARLLDGKPFVAAVTEVLLRGYDLVMKQSEGRGSSSWLFGSTDLHLIRKCPVPVWIVKPGESASIGKILAAVDPVSSRGDQLDRLILDLASSLGRRHGAELHVLHAWSLGGEGLLRFDWSRLPSSLERLKDEVRRQAADEFDALLAQRQLSRSVHVHLRQGAPSEEIVGAAREVEADLIVMGSISDVGVAGVLIGGTAERVLGRVDCSVLTVKPAGFVSPLAKGLEGASLRAASGRG